MDIDRSINSFKLSEEEARVALAYLGESDTGMLLRSQVAENIMSRRIMRVGISNYTEADPDEMMRVQTPHLYEYQLPLSHRAPLVGAFALAAEAHEPLEATVLEGLDQEEITALSTAARDMLLSNSK